MNTVSNPHVWLAYVPYPITTAVYLERALRKNCHVTTVGPPFPLELIEAWSLQNLKLPFATPDLVTSFQPDMATIIGQDGPQQQPDLYLWVESVGGYFPENLDCLPCPKACYLIDTHLCFSWHLQWACQFDYVFLAQREYVERFRTEGLNAHWLPLACDPEIHAPTAGLPKLHDLSFVGSLSHNPRRQQLLKALDEAFGIHCERCWWDDMARVIGQSHITFNNAVKNDLNMRVFEALSIGTLLVTDLPKNSGQDLLFKNGEDLAVYRRDDELLDVIRFYMNNPALRDDIANRGRRLVHNAHTYAHRAADLLAVSLNGKPATFSANELREQSLPGVEPAFCEHRQSYISIGSASRSFVIPVLDYSPASEYSIVTLLTDLEQVEGDVIVIFNNEQVADELKRHPRITRYAVMKENIGVARAWNVGLQMAATPVVFILNADLHLLPESVETLEKGLLSLEKAACVGPQGSFVDIPLTRDHLYFDKGNFDQPIAVDAVSGFYFAIKSQHFSDKLLSFENAYTPCYFEEWDLGLQIKRVGLSSYIVPTTAYDHHWSGSIRALREIVSFGRSETAGEILQRNRRLFLHKWRYIAAAENRPDLLESAWKDFGPSYAGRLFSEGALTEAEAVVQSLMIHYPDDPQVLALAIKIAFEKHDMQAVSKLNKQLRTIAPDFVLSLNH